MNGIQRTRKLTVCVTKTKLGHYDQVVQILIKGWSAARFYPEQGLRPYGDIDICVREEQYQEAKRELLRLELPQFAVDLHRGFSKLGVSEDENLFTRSQLVRVGETDSPIRLKRLPA